MYNTGLKSLNQKKGPAKNSGENLKIKCRVCIYSHLMQKSQKTFNTRLTNFTIVDQQLTPIPVNIHFFYQQEKQLTHNGRLF